MNKEIMNEFYFPVLSPLYECDEGYLLVFVRIVALNIDCFIQFPWNWYLLAGFFQDILFDMILICDTLWYQQYFIHTLILVHTFCFKLEFNVSLEARLPHDITWNFGKREKKLYFQHEGREFQQTWIDRICWGWEWAWVTDCCCQPITKSATNPWWLFFQNTSPLVRYTRIPSLLASILSHFLHQFWHVLYMWHKLIMVVCQPCHQKRLVWKVDAK